MSIRITIRISQICCFLRIPVFFGGVGIWEVNFFISSFSVSVKHNFFFSYEEKLFISTFRIHSQKVKRSFLNLSSNYQTSLRYFSICLFTYSVVWPATFHSGNENSKLLLMLDMIKFYLVNTYSSLS